MSGVRKTVGRSNEIRETVGRSRCQICLVELFNVCPWIRIHFRHVSSFRGSLAA